MDVVQPASAAEFLERAAPLLVADEARHNLVLGIAGAIRDDRALYPEHRFWLVEDGGAPAAAALRTPPYNLVLARGSDGALAALARSIEDELPGAFGAVPEIDRFVAAWTEGHDVRAEVRSRQATHELDVVVPPQLPRGRARAATVADRELLVTWLLAFGAEAGGAGANDAERQARNVDHKLAAPADGFELWEVDEEPVSLVGFGSPTPTGIRIGPVYTPPEHRGRGYASALTAHVSAEQLAAGRRFCFLYTDLANPTSNKIYAALGYRRVCDAIEYAFV